MAAMLLVMVEDGEGGIDDIHPKHSENPLVPSKLFEEGGGDVDGSLTRT
jgi:hypothetical protein